MKRIVMLGMVFALLVVMAFSTAALAHNGKGPGDGTGTGVCTVTPVPTHVCQDLNGDGVCGKS